MRRMLALLGALFSALTTLIPGAVAQTNSYKQTNLVSDTQGMAANTDPKLLNPWGIAFVPGQPFWISDNNSGFTTLYDQNGVSQGSFVVAPPAGSSNPATPTGIVAPPSGVNFIVGGQTSIFIFDTEDGTISGWTGGSSTILAVDNSKIPSPALSAVYKGLALLQGTSGNFLLAANFRSGKVEVYDTNYHQTQVFGATAFEDPALPAVPAGSGSPGYAPFGIHTVVLGGKTMVVVTYALQDAPMHDPLHIAGGGVVDLFNADGTMARRLTADSHLNAPWGVVIPPKSFGPFGTNGNVLVGNFGDGVINAYDAASGSFVDQLKDSTGTAIINVSLWDMVFGQGAASGDPNTMYITAGLANEAHGLFSAITANATTPPVTGDFSISATPTSMTISAGQAAQFTVSLGGLNGFNGAVTLTCSGQPLGSTCSFTQSSLSPASGATATTTMKISTSSAPYMPAGVMAKNADGRIYAMLLAIPTFGLLGIFVLGAPREYPSSGKRWVRYLLGSVVLLIVTSCLLAAGGCGGGSNSAGTGTKRGPTTVMITGTSGNLSHSASVALTVQ